MLLVSVLCSVVGHASLPSLCKATCDQPSTTGYVFDNAAGTTTIDGFAVTGVTCGTGYGTGTVTSTACASAGSTYSVSGCKALPCNFICALLGATCPFTRVVVHVAKLSEKKTNRLHASMWLPVGCVWGISYQVPRPTQLSSSLWSVVCGAVLVLSTWYQVPGDKQA